MADRSIAVKQVQPSGQTTQEFNRPESFVSGETSITLKVNGTAMKATVEPRTTLLDVLRYQFDLTGAMLPPVSNFEW